MKRSALVYLALAAVAVVAVAWFLDTYERTTTKVWVGPSGEARTNPYLAALRFMQRMGTDASLLERGLEPARLPIGATLLLPSGRTSYTPERIAALVLWVRSGGHLVVEPEPSERRDALLDALHIGRHDPPDTKLPEVFQIAMPTTEYTLRVSAILRTALDIGRRPNPDAEGKQGGSTWFASWPEGAGRITVLDGIARFRNRGIGEHDNADLLRRTWEMSPASRQMLIARVIDSPPLWAWLGQYALGPLVAGSMLLALWLTRQAVRLGPIRPAPPAQRRRLLEHVRACGRFRWSQGARASLLAAAREICQRRMLTLDPRLGHMVRAQRDRELAASTGMSEEVITRAFDATPHSAREFVQIVATLASIHGALGRTGRVRALGKRTR